MIEGAKISKFMETVIAMRQVMALQGKRAMNLKPHPLADLFPLMGDDELAALAADIKEHGQREPIVVHDGLILDGRNRYRACQLAGVEPTTIEWDGDVAALVNSMNILRRHMTASQRGMIASELANMKSGERTDLKENSLRSVSVPHAAKLVQVDQKTVSDARTVQTKGTPEEVKAVIQGKASVSATATKIRERTGTKRPSPAKANGRPATRERSQDSETKSLIWQQVKEALERLTTLPNASDVASILRLKKTPRFNRMEQFRAIFDCVGA